MRTIFGQKGRHDPDASGTQPSDQDRNAVLEKEGKSLTWYKNRHASVEAKYKMLGELKQNEAELREQLKEKDGIIKSERNRADAAEQTLLRQPSGFPTLTRGSGKGAGIGRPYTPEYEDMATMLLATGLSVIEAHAYYG